MRLESTISEVHGAGAEVIAISVNEDERQAGMAERWKLNHIQMVSDPGGERFLQPLGLFNPDERDGIALPANIVVAPDGSEAYRYNGRDFADRTTDTEVTAALAGLGLPAIDPGPCSSSTSVPADLEGCFRPSDYGAYFRGNKFAGLAIGGRLPSKEMASFARDHSAMADASLEAWAKLDS